MGLDDRDYMKWDYRQRNRKRNRGTGGGAGGTDLPLLVVTAGKVLLTLIGMAMCFRVPVPPVLRIALAIGALLLGTHWIMKSLRR